MATSEDDVKHNEIDRSCTADKRIIEILLKKYKSQRTPSEKGVTVWIEVYFNNQLINYLEYFMTKLQVTR